MKVLIALDTNPINTSNYKTCRLGGDFDTVMDYIRDNKLEKNIKIIIPETVTKELFKHIRNSYDADLTTLISFKNKISGAPSHKITLEYPNASDYYKDIQKQLNNEILKFNFIKISKLPESKKINALNSIIENCYEDQTRFHDQLIIEEIKHYRYLNNYDRIILYTNNLKDFEDYVPTNIELYSSWEDLKDSLDAIFLIGDTEEETKFKRFVETEYAKELVQEAVGSEFKILKIEYDTMIPEVEGEEAFFIVKFKGIGTRVKYEVWGEAFFDITNRITNIEINYH